MIVNCYHSFIFTSCFTSCVGTTTVVAVCCDAAVAIFYSVVHHIWRERTAGLAGYLLRLSGIEGD
jgi:hypothetical protein